MAFTPRPTFSTWNRQQQIGLALDTPFTFTQALTENADQGLKDSFGFGTFMRAFDAGDRRATTGPEGLANAARFLTDSVGITERDQSKVLTEDEYASSPYHRDEIPYDAGMTEDRAASLATMYDKKKVRERFSQKQPVAAFLGQFAGQAFDPINYVPVFGEAVQGAAVAKFGSIAGRALLSASDAAINTAAFGVLTSGIRAKFGDDVSWQSITSDIAMSALIGGVFGTGAGVLARGADRRAMAVAQARPRLETLGNTMEARATLNDAVAGIVDRAEVALSPNSLGTIERMADEITDRTSGLRQLREETAGVTGSKAGEVAIAPSGARVAVRPEVVELSSLIRATGALQVRDRTGAASAAQVEDIALNLDAARLMPNIDASQGAPLVGTDNIIDSGNGRTMGIQRAYEAYPEKAAAYRQALVDAGYADAAGMQQPVLINRRLTELSEPARVQFNAELNGPTTARMSAVELAAMDREALTGPVMDALGDAPVTAASNRGFVRGFLSNLPQNERGALLERDGKTLNADGARRIENALVAAAYGDVDAGVLRRFAEATDDNTRSIVGALSDVAGTWANMRAAIKRQEVGAEFDLTPELTQALRLLGRWREDAAREGRPVATVIREGLAQLDLLSGEVSPEAQTFIRMFYENDHFGRAVGRDTLAARLRTVAASTLELGRPSLFGDTLMPTKGEVLTNAQRDEADAFAADGLEPRPAEDRGAGGDGEAEGIGSADRPGLEGRSIAAVMTDRFAAAGRPADEAAAAAQIVDAFYTTMAQRTGMPVDEFTRRFGLPEVVRGGEVGAGDFAQAAAPDTPEFRAWFGDSKVVDAEGKPLVVYHGTDSAFAAFAPNQFFTSSQAVAGTYGKRLEPVYLSIKNPLVVEGGGKDFSEVPQSSLFEQAKRDGHDGLIVRNVIDDADGSVTEVADNYIAFRPEQIKSTANRGTFDASDPRILFQPAYHGTPHVFDAFSTDKMGSGEGNQSFGWGVYLAGKKDVAQYYREKLSAEWRDGDDMKWGGRTALEHYEAAERRGEYGKMMVLERIMLHQPKSEIRARIDEALAEDATDTQAREGLAYLKTLPDEAFPKTGGRLLTVDIPDDAELLDWDKPLAQQPPKVKEALQAAGLIKEFKENLSDFSSPQASRGKGKGANLYSYLAWKLGSDEAASRRLIELGIPGHKYPAGTIANVKGKGHNYVIYDDARVKITSFEQGGARGAINLDTNVMRLFETADASTALHESGHLFLGMYKRIADDATAPSALRAEWDAIKRWWSANAGDVAADANASGRAEGVTDADVRKVLADGTSGDKAKDLAIDVGLHEQWARAFEAYVRDGKAPSEGLRGVFEQFKRWLSSLYQQAKDLNVNLSDDIRAVFDRMLTMEPVSRDEPGLFGQQPSRPTAPVNSTTPQPDPVPDGLVAAEARVGKGEDIRQLAEVHGVKEDGSFVEQLEIDQMREEGRLSPEDEAELDAAEQDYANADAWARSLEVAGRCMI